MEKGDWQIITEKSYKNTSIERKYKLKITKLNPETNHVIGEIVNVSQFGTFGCWDEQNRWVDFYSCEIV